MSTPDLRPTRARSPSPRSTHTHHQSLPSFPASGPGAPAAHRHPHRRRASQSNSQRLPKILSTGRLVGSDDGDDDDDDHESAEQTARRSATARHDDGCAAAAAAVTTDTAAASHHHYRDPTFYSSATSVYSSSDDVYAGRTFARLKSGSSDPVGPHGATVVDSAGGPEQRRGSLASGNVLRSASASASDITSANAGGGGGIGSAAALRAFPSVMFRSVAEGLFPEYRRLRKPGSGQGKGGDEDRVRYFSRGGGAGGGGGTGSAFRVPRNRAGTLGIEITSSPMLQLLLYLNVWFAPMWWLATVLVVRFKIAHFATGVFHRFLLRAIVVVSTFSEPLRIYMGYDGNLREKVPSLTIFLLLTLFPAVPTALYLTLLQPYLGDGFVLPFEIALNILYGLLLLIPQALAAYSAIRDLIRAQAALFAVGGGAGATWGATLDASGFDDDEEDGAGNRRAWGNGIDDDDDGDDDRRGAGGAAAAAAAVQRTKWTDVAARMVGGIFDRKNRGAEGGGDVASRRGTAASSALLSTRALGGGGGGGDAAGPRGSLWMLDRDGGI